MKAKLEFRKWLTLEQNKKTICEAVERNDFADAVFAYLSTASFVPVSKYEVTEWQKIIVMLLSEFKENQPNNNLPLLKSPPDDKSKLNEWDYPGRNWYYWSHLISKTYSWSLEYIAALDVNDALAFVQEILTDEQLEKEFMYGLSEIAYPYNSQSKKSTFKPLPRPYWMKPAIPKMKVQKFRREHLPVGNVQDISGMPLEYNPLRDSVHRSDLPAQ